MPYTSLFASYLHRDSLTIDYRMAMVLRTFLCNDIIAIATDVSHLAENYAPLAQNLGTTPVLFYLKCLGLKDHGR